MLVAEENVPKVEKKYLTFREFGERVGLNYESVRRLVRGGDVEAVNFGKRKMRIAESEYERWVIENMKKVD